MHGYDVHEARKNCEIHCLLVRGPCQGRGKYGLILKMYQLLDSILLPYIFEKKLNAWL